LIKTTAKPTKTPTKKATVTKTPTTSPAKTATPKPRGAGDEATDSTNDRAATQVAIDRTGTFAVVTVDRADQRVTGACFALMRGDVAVARVCDGDDGELDGRTVLTDVEEGRYVLVAEISPDRFRPVADRKVTVRAGKIRTLEITLRG